MDYIPTSGFLDKNELLEYLEEEEIFSLVLGYKPQELEYICNPLRIDNTPGAYFETNPFTGRLELIDWGYSPHHIDSFLLVQKFFKIPNFYQTLVFVRDNLLYSKSEIKKIEKTKDVIKEKKQFQIYCQPRQFDKLTDSPIWSPYGIVPSHLTEDRVFSISQYAFKNAKKNGPFQCYTPTYAICNFVETGKKKLYFPLKKEKKYITDCKNDDIGGLNYFNRNLKKCVINKGYKDYRVFRNIGVNNFWTQSEVILPSDDMLGGLLENMSEVIVFFDNDLTGISKGQEFTQHINNLFGFKKAHQYYLPVEMRKNEIKDPSDLRKQLGYDEAFRDFIFKEVCKT